MLALADIGISVSDAQAAARWWKEKLGFHVHHLSEHAVMVAPPGERFLLHLCEGFERVDPGNTGIAFMDTDIDRTVARMMAGGVVFTEPLTKTAWGGSAKFQDPDGNVFWLVGAPEEFVKMASGLKAPSE